MNEHKTNKDQDFVREAFRQAEGEAPEPSSELQARIVSRLGEEAGRAQVRRWKRWALLGPMAAAAALMMMFTWFSPSVHEGVVGKNMLVSIELSPEDQSGISYAQVKLPEGVTFYSEAYPDLHERRSLTLAFNGSAEVHRIPVVIRSESVGLKTLALQFLDHNAELISARNLKIQFREET